MVCVIRSHAAIRLKSRSACSTSITFRRMSRIRRSFSTPTNSAVDPLDDVGGAIGLPHCGGARGGWARGVGETPPSESEANSRRALGFLEGLAPSPVSVRGRLLLWATPAISHLSLRAAHDRQMRTRPAGGHWHARPRVVHLSQSGLWSATSRSYRRCQCPCSP